VDSNQAKSMARSLDISYLQGQLNSIGWVKPIVMNQVSSTNDLSFENLHQVTPGNALVVVANEQTAGRGRLDRTWSTPAGSGIAMSISAHISDFEIELTAIPLLTGIAVHRALKQFSVPVELKWPNDIIFSEPSTRKLGGILLQLHSEKLIIGIGINVHMSLEELPVPTATSLLIEGFQINRMDLIAGIISELNSLRTANTDWLPEYKAVCATIGKKVLIQNSNGTELNGLAIDVGNDGSLLVKNLEKIYQITVGDVEHMQVLAD
jgi:BirA family biotin operon repressor/biotin-[acetyl-CoA-carboxylase] ligase